LSSVKKEIRRKKEILKQEFDERYDKTKPYKWKDLEEINMQKHFYLPKFMKDFGGRISKPALAIYPVLCSKADFEINRPFQISQACIGELAGLNVSTVNKATRELVEQNFVLVTHDTTGESSGSVPLLSREKITKGTRHFYVYRVGFIRKNMMEDWRKNFFIFHTCLIETEVWRSLSLRAKVLYLTMREFAQFDPYLYDRIEYDGELGLEDYEGGTSEFYNTDKYRNRRWDVCDVSLARLCRIAGMTSPGMKEIIEELEGYKLVERVGRWFMVYLKPKKICSSL